jgi:peptidyl-prolyl cis-trans isomerase SurA
LKSPRSCVLFLALLCHAERVDRLAVTAGPIVITEQQIVRQLTVAGLLDQKAPDLSNEAKRRTAEQLIDQAIVRGEMEASRYPLPSAEEVDRATQHWEASLPAGTLPAEALQQRGISREELRESLQRQLAVLRFIEYRFRPGITIEDNEIADYYRSVFLEEQREARPGEAVPSLPAARGNIIEALTQQQIDAQLERWLNASRQQLQVRYREAVFGAAP